MSDRRPRIVNAEPLRFSAEARALLERVGDVVEAPLGLTRADLLRLVVDADVLIVRLGFQVDAEVLAAAPRLRAVVTATTGLDHVDLAAAHARGVTVLSLRGEAAFLEGVRATPEHTWALLLALARRLVPAAGAVLAGEWDRERYRGRELNCRRLGLLGCGRVGRIVARYAAAFDMPVAAYDPYVGTWPDGVERCAGLDDLLARSDVLAVCATLTDETRGLLDARALALLPAGAMLVNTSRGEIVDEAALVRALERGHLAGAALDVVAHERDPQGRQAGPLLAYAATHDNLLLTPHLGGATYESMERTEVFMARKLVRFLEEVSAHAA